MGIGTASLFSGLAASIGEERVSTDYDVCASVAVDGLPPQCVVCPRSAEDVAAILAWSREQGLAVIPYSNATKLHTGNIPRRYDVALCLKEMNQVPHFEPADLTASAGPGVNLGDFQQLLGRHGLWLPLDPPGGAESSLGGIVATNAAGPLRLKYGAPRDIVLGLKIATTSGKVVKTGGRVVKNVAGYDLAKLIAGSFGTLGVIVEISFKLFPRPARRVTWVLSVPGFEAARDLRRRVLNSPLFPLRMVLLDGGAAKYARGQPAVEGPDEEFEIWIEFGGTERVIQRCKTSVKEVAAKIGSTPDPLENSFAEACWNRICDFSAGASAYFLRGLTLKAILPVAASEEFVRRMREEAGKHGVRAACLSHNGMIQICLAPENAQGGAIVGHLREIASSQGGAVVIERCSPELKKQIEVWGPPGDDFEVMRRLKEAWDPASTLSPGRFVGRL